MSPTIDDWKKWQGQVINGKFPLQQWLGASEDAGVFLTAMGGRLPRAAIKLVAIENRDEQAQLSRWAAAAKLAHPHLIRLFDGGRCQLGDRRFLYVVMEYAEEDLSQILPLRPLSGSEVQEMLRPAASALAYLHELDLVHGHIKPANIMAVDNHLKISADSVAPSGEKDLAHHPSGFDAPEVATSGRSTAADIWSLGATMVAALSQKPPQLNGSKAIVPETLLQPFREIARQCLQADPQQRGSVSDVLSRLREPAAASPARSRPVADVPKLRSKKPVFAAIAVGFIVLGLLVGRAVMSHRPEVPTPPTESQSSSGGKASPAPFAQAEQRGPADAAIGSVLEQVLPNVPQSARNTITGKIKVGVRVSVDEAGQVTDAKIVSSGHSAYFDRLALAAARRWKFTPPQKNGQPMASSWNLRFQFSRSSTQASPAEAR